MQVFEENLNLKEKIREFEVDDNTAEFNIREKIDHNHIFLMEVQQKLHESIEARKLLNAKFEKLCYLSGMTPDDLEREKSSINGSATKNHMAQLERQLDELKFEKLNLKEQIQELEKSNLQLEEKLEEKEHVIKKLDDEKESLSVNYEKRITQLKEGFQDKTSFLSMNISQDLNEEPNLKQQTSQNMDELEVCKKRIEELEQELVYN